MGMNPKGGTIGARSVGALELGQNPTEQLSIYPAKMKLTPSVNKRSYWPSKPVMMFWGWKPLKLPTSMA